MYIFCIISRVRTGTGHHLRFSLPAHLRVFVAPWACGLDGPQIFRKRPGFCVKTFCESHKKKNNKPQPHRFCVAIVAKEVLQSLETFKAKFPETSKYRSHRSQTQTTHLELFGTSEPSNIFSTLSESEEKHPNINKNASNSNKNPHNQMFEDLGRQKKKIRSPSHLDAISAFAVRPRAEGTPDSESCNAES